MGGTDRCKKRGGVYPPPATTTARSIVRKKLTLDFYLLPCRSAFELAFLTLTRRRDRSIAKFTSPPRQRKKKKKKTRGGHRLVYRRIRIPTSIVFKISYSSPTNPSIRPPRYPNRYSKNEKRKWYVLGKKSVFEISPEEREEFTKAFLTKASKNLSLFLSLSINFVFLGNEERRAFHVLCTTSL